MWFDFQTMFDQITKHIGHVKELKNIDMKKKLWVKGMHL
jgi:hypothetical protein